MISSVDPAHYGVSCAKDRVYVRCGTRSRFSWYCSNTKSTSVILFLIIFSSFKLLLYSCFYYYHYYYSAEHQQLPSYECVISDLRNLNELKIRTGLTDISILSSLVTFVKAEENRPCTKEKKNTCKSNNDTASNVMNSPSRQR